jgi:hypothetical protein
VLLFSLQEFSWRCEKLEIWGFMPPGNLFCLVIVLNEFHVQNIYNHNILVNIFVSACGFDDI